MADGFDCAAAAGLEPVGQLLQVGGGDPGQQGLGELGLVLPPHHKVLVLKVPHILVPQVLYNIRHRPMVQWLRKHCNNVQVGASRIEC